MNMNKILLKGVTGFMAFLLLFMSSVIPSTVGKAQSYTMTDCENMKSMTQYILDNTIELKNSEKDKLLKKAIKAIKKGKVTYHLSNEQIFDNP